MVCTIVENIIKQKSYNLHLIDIFYVSFNLPQITVINHNNDYIRNSFGIKNYMGQPEVYLYL